jgi:hypothetical protein
MSTPEPVRNILCRVMRDLETMRSKLAADIGEFDSQRSAEIDSITERIDVLNVLAKKNRRKASESNAK